MSVSSGSGVATAACSRQLQMSSPVPLSPEAAAWEPPPMPRATEFRAPMAPPILEASRVTAAHGGTAASKVPPNPLPETRPAPPVATPSWEPPSILPYSAPPLLLGPAPATQPTASHRDVQAATKDPSQCCEEYEAYLQSMRELQSPATQAIVDYLRLEIASAVNDWQVAAPIDVQVFGSRSYEVELPGSDLDVVCLLPEPESGSHGLDQYLLRGMFQRLRSDPRCSAVEDKIEGVTTVTFHFAGLPIDFSVCCGGHPPSQITNRVAKELRRLPGAVRSLARLTVDTGKRFGFCWKKKGPIGKQLKGVHWVMLVVAWWRHCGAEARAASREVGSHELLEMVLRFYADFDFEASSIYPFLAAPMFRREYPWPEPLWLEDPVRRGRNLAWRIDTPEALQRMRAALRQALQSLTTRPHVFWREARERWSEFEDRSYSAEVAMSAE